MRLLFITQKMDCADWLLGFTHGWVQSLAARVERLTVICLAQGETDLPSNVKVISLGKERGVSRAGRAIRFGRAMAESSREVDGVFTHMSPAFAIAAAPFAKRHRVPLVMWYTHRHVDFKLHVATALCDAVATASPESFQLPTNKVRVISHGIDTQRFSPGRPSAPGPPTLVAVGRRSPVKHYELLIDAARILAGEFGHPDLRVRIVGGDVDNAPPGYADHLRATIERAGLAGVVTLAGAVSYEQVPQEYRNATIHVNLSPTGGLDKAVLEGMATGVPTVVRNGSFRPIFGNMADELVADGDDARALAEKLDAILCLPEAGRQGLGERLRQIAVREFGQEALADRLVAMFRELRRR
nr:glycosyltransferase family 4 protein [Chloroflexota bacterium]